MQMVPKIGARDPRCLAPFWNWFNETAVNFFLDKVLAPLVAQEGFDVVFFDGADGFIRGARFSGSWQHASNVPAGTTHADAVQALLRLHSKMAEVCRSHGKYAILSEHLQTPATPLHLMRERLSTASSTRPTCAIMKTSCAGRRGSEIVRRDTCRPSSQRPRTPASDCLR